MSRTDRAEKIDVENDLRKLVFSEPELNDLSVLKSHSSPGRTVWELVSSVRNAWTVSYLQGLHCTKNQYPTIVEEFMDSIHLLRSELPSKVDEPVIEASVKDTKGVVDDCIFGLPTSYSKDAILSQYMPSTDEAERLLATYLGSGAFIQPFDHTEQLQDQYHLFRNDQFHSAPGFWLSILFSVFSIAAFAHGAAVIGQKAHSPSNDFLTAAGQCLAFGQHHTIQRASLAALLLYAHCKGLRSLDPSRECGTMICMAVRHACELGYHRDLDTFCRVTVFEGEMRRRFWACCKQVDTMVSYQLGLPGNIRFDNCDTRSPLNPLDSDFHVETRILPPSVPESEPTPILWFIIKDRLMPTFAKICQAALSLRVGIEAEIA